MNDHRRAKLIGQSPAHPEKHWLVDLDTAPVAVAEPGQSDPATIFQTVDRGPPVKLSITR